MTTESGGTPKNLDANWRAASGFAASAIVADVATLCSAAGWSQVKEIPWGTSAVGSAGHKGLVVFAEVMNREMKKYRITVQPTPGAIVSVSDIAFYEMANDIKRFKGFKSSIKRQPVQSLWVFTTDMGIAVHVRDKDKYKSWQDLKGKAVFTGMPPWDTRAQLERIFETLGIKYNYRQVDLSAAGSLLQSGRIDGFGLYTNGEASIPPWIAEAILMPFYYGYHVGLEGPEADVYQMLMLVEKNAAELAKADASFAQIAKGMAAFQRRGVESSVNLVPVHPGLAKYMREKNVWDAKWDARVAK